jgi:hypothetical protein
MPLGSVVNTGNGVKGEWRNGDGAAGRKLGWKRFCTLPPRSGQKKPTLSAKAQKKPATPKNLEVAGLIFLSRFTTTTQNRCGPMNGYWAVVKEAVAGFADPPLALKPQTKTL